MDLVPLDLISGDFRIGAQAVGVQSAAQMAYFLKPDRRKVHRRMQAADFVMAVKQDFLVAIERPAPVGDLVGGMEFRSRQVAQGEFLRIAHVDQARRLVLRKQIAQLFRSHIAKEFFSHRNPAAGWG